MTTPSPTARSREKLAPDKGEDKSKQSDKDDAAIEAVAEDEAA